MLWDMKTWEGAKQLATHMVNGQQSSRHAPCVFQQCLFYAFWSGSHCHTSGDTCEQTLCSGECPPCIIPVLHPPLRAGGSGRSGTLLKNHIGHLFLRQNGVGDMHCNVGPAQHHLRLVLISQRIRSRFTATHVVTALTTVSAQPEIRELQCIGISKSRPTDTATLPRQCGKWQCPCLSS